jgi:predicted kinase
VTTLSDWLEADWTTLSAELPWLERLRGVRQDVVYHAEGDVWIHTRMVREALVGLPAFSALPRHAQELVHAAALLHDVAKPWTTRAVFDDALMRERVTARGHSASGAAEARKILWELGVPVVDREAIAALVLRHQLPFFCVDDPAPERRAVLTSQTTRCDHLALVNEADALGRDCDDHDKLAENVALFRLLCEELGCLSAPFPFASPTARLRFSLRPDATRWEQPPEIFKCQVVVMAGLPGSGKDTWIRDNLPDWPVVSLDAIRRDQGVDPRAPQGPIAAAAREQARVFLRRQQPFVWNATNLTRPIRAKVIKLALDYGARVRVVHVETPHAEHARRNANREHAVPRAAIARMLRGWTLPEVTEAHEVSWVVSAG